MLERGLVLEIEEEVNGITEKTENMVRAVMLGFMLRMVGLFLRLAPPPVAKDCAFLARDL